MIRVYFKKLENGNLEITEKMLNDILSYMKRQDDRIKEIKDYAKDLMFPVSDTLEYGIGNELLKITDNLGVEKQ